MEQAPRGSFTGGTPLRRERCSRLKLSIEDGENAGSMMRLMGPAGASWAGSAGGGSSLVEGGGKLDADGGGAAKAWAWGGRAAGGCQTGAGEGWAGGA